MATKKTAHSWSDVKAQLAAFDRAGLLGLVQDLYAASKDNQAFLHARLHLGDDVLKPYEAAIDRWLWPNVLQQQDTSVAKAKKAIADYRQASGTAEGLAELMVFYCEQAAGFSADVALDDEGYLSALVRGGRVPPRRRHLVRRHPQTVQSQVRSGSDRHADSPRWPAAHHLHAVRADPAHGGKASQRAT
jgi:hypothetical protein